MTMSRQHVETLQVGGRQRTQTSTGTSTSNSNSVSPTRARSSCGAVDGPRHDNIDSMPYAIDAEMCNKGRRFAATKRRVKFSFGFGNRAAIERGLSSSDCRGEEHQVVLIWSLTSGKQRVLADGIEVHFSRHSVTNKFECQWTMKAGHHISVKGHWAPLAKDVRNFDLCIDGCSFWRMPKIFQLGGTSGKGFPAAPRRRTIAALPALIPDLCVDASMSTSASTSSCASNDHLLSSSHPTSAKTRSPSRKKPQHENNDYSEALLSPMELALKSLVNMDACPSPTANHMFEQTAFGCMSRSESISDLSVQSAYASTQPSSALSLFYPHRQHSHSLQSYGETSTSYSVCGWPTGQNQWESQPVYTFAG